MDMDTQVVDILICPITGNRLRLLSDNELADLNGRITKGSVNFFNGERVKSEISSGFIDDSYHFVYEIKEGIILMLKNLAISYHDMSEVPDIDLADDIMLGNQNFYDEFGWKKGEEGFNDAELWEDLRPVSAKYRRECHLKINKHIQKSGKYIVDVASGPIQYPEYLTYSKNYEFRICIDVSIAALKQAKSLLGENGVYIVGDITNIPIQNGVVDAVVSLHTIYHVHRDKQIKAFNEIYRILKSGRTAAIVYVWRNSLLMQKIDQITQVIYRVSMPMIKLFVPTRRPSILNKKKELEDQKTKDSSNKSVDLYFFPYDYDWLSKNLRIPYKLYSWRSVSVPFLRKYIHPWFFGRLILAVLLWLEEIYPKMFGKIGQYPLIVLTKRQ